MRRLLPLLLALPCSAQVRLAAPTPVPVVSVRSAPVLAPALSLPLALRAPLPIPILKPSLAAPEGPDMKKPAEAVSAEAAAAFDGAAVPKSESSQPESLAVADPADAPLVADVVAAAERSRAGRRVLKRVAELAQKRGRPIVVIVSRLEQNNGDFVYDWDTVRLGAHFRKGDPAEAAPTLMHELAHVLQKEAGLPTDSLELELEAFMVTLKVSRELGLPLKKGSFERKVSAKLRESVGTLVDWLTDQYTGNRPISEGIPAYIDHLEEQEAKTLASIARLEKRLARQLGIIQGMAESGISAEAVKDYRDHAVGGIERKIHAQKAALFWIRRDIDTLSTPAGAARYRAFAKKVMADLRRTRASLD